MATKKDLVEAHAFSRRRLVTAFLSGAPGGREVEPSRPGRTIVGGLALSVLLVAGAAVASVLASRTPADWNKEGLILSRENAALYVILDEADPPVLHPVINATSAQLIFGADAEATIVSRETVDAQTPGSTLGIFGAPQTLPTTDDLIQTGWTACTGDGLGIKVDVDRAQLTQPSVAADLQSTDPESAFVVRTAGDGRTYLVATGALGEDGRRARYFEIPDAGLDAALIELGLGPTDDAIEVPGDWLRLFEPGGSLSFESFGIDGYGEPLPGALGQALAAQDGRVGDYLPAAEDGSTTARVMTKDGPLPLDPFAAAIYANVTVPGTSSTPRPLDPVDLPNVGFAGLDYEAAGWPRTLLDQPPVQPCAVLTPQPGSRPAVQLGIDPRGEASAADVTDPEAREIRVQPGYGAYVYSGTFEDSTSETPLVIDSKGDYYPLVDLDTIDRLGYSSVDMTVVPDTWIELFDDGVPLSTSAALCPPDSTGTAPDQTCSSGPGGSGDTGDTGDTAESGATGATGSGG